MRMVTGILAIAAAMASSTTIAAEPLSPSGKWTVEHEERLCVLSRTFGSPSAATTLIFRPYLTGEGEQIALLLPDNGDRRVRRGGGHIILQPSGQRFAMRYAAGSLGDGRARAINIDLEQGSIRTALSEAATVTVQAGASVTSVQLKGTASAMRALKTCEDGLLRSWGADPAQMTSFIQPGLVGTWFNYNAYPPEAMEARAQGHVIAMVAVDPKGDPTECRVVAESGNAALDRQTCLILQRRARYLPAEAGMTAKRWSVTSVRWTMP